MDRTQLIANCRDLFGYTVEVFRTEEFEGMTYEEIWDYLTIDQQKQVTKFSK